MGVREKAHKKLVNSKRRRLGLSPVGTEAASSACLSKLEGRHRATLKSRQWPAQ